MKETGGYIVLNAVRVEVMRQAIEWKMKRAAKRGGDFIEAFVSFVHNRVKATASRPPIHQAVERRVSPAYHPLHRAGWSTRLQGTTLGASTLPTAHGKVRRVPDRPVTPLLHVLATALMNISNTCTSNRPGRNKAASSRSILFVRATSSVGRSSSWNPSMRARSLHDIT